MIRILLSATLVALLVPASSPVCAGTGIEVIDDAGRTISLEQPAQRIISLAPHVTENLFSAGVGEQVVGTVNYSDYPSAAQSIPQVGGYDNINIEVIHALQPDLIIAWQEGNQLIQVEQLMNLGYTVYIDYPRDFPDVARSIRNFGILAGNAGQAGQAADGLLAQMNQLRDSYAGYREVSVFYQVWSAPLITVNKDQIIGRSIRLCGGRNIFADLNGLTPRVNVEDVLAANPEVIIASGMDEQRPEWLDDWAKWSFLGAVRNNHLFFIPPDIIQRHTARLLEGTRMMCEFIHQVRLHP
jgi:iron complex transport system substrate-binding protein